MAVKFPYLPTPGLIPKILSKIQEARRPERFTQDFLETKLGQTGGSARAFIPLLKRMEFLSPDGTPTRLYDQYRNSDTQGLAVAEGMRNAYSEIFDRNRYAGDLSKDKLQALITEMSGLEKDSSVLRLVVSTFWTLKQLADFEAAPKESASATVDSPPAVPRVERAPADNAPERRDLEKEAGRVGLNIGYTINLNLPETTNPEVFNAIFRALRENLLKD